MIAVCLKWVDLQPSVGAGVDARFAGMSGADEAALEWALRLAHSDEPVHAVTFGPHGAEVVVRAALACGATQATHVTSPRQGPSRAVAGAIATVVSGARLVLCGDSSLDRGSGSVPAFLAAELGIAQALGLVALHPERSGTKPTGLTVVRRLDGGRRERLRIPARAVLSVEGSSATLRRAGARATLAADRAVIDSRPAPPFGPGLAEQSAAGGAVGALRSFRPRPRALAAPEGATLDRLRSLTAATTAGTGGRSEPVVMDPAAAATAILDSLPAM